MAKKISIGNSASLEFEELVIRTTTNILSGNIRPVEHVASVAMVDK